MGCWRFLRAAGLGTRNECDRFGLAVTRWVTLWREVDMLKLPKRAKVFLEGVRGVHDPADPVAARERVLVRLEAALSRQDTELFRPGEVTVTTILEWND